MVRNYDVDVPANTIRAWVIGMILCTVGSGVNMLFSLRNPSVAITTYVVQLVAYPIGLAWDLVMPDREWNVFGLKFNLRPGKFNYKEHVVIVAMSNVSCKPPYLNAAAYPRSRLRMVVALCMPLMSFWPRNSSMARTLAGPSSYSSVSPPCALATVLPVLPDAFWSGLLL